MPAVGDKAPLFTLRAADGSPVTLRSLRGAPVVLYFYPKDDTPSCTTEACEFRDRWRAVRTAGATVLGVSPDSVASHARFAAKYRLPFPLLADPDHRVARAYGVWGEKQLFGHRYLGVIRTTFLIDAKGSIAHVFSPVRPKGHAAQVLAVLKNLKAKV